MPQFDIKSLLSIASLYEFVQLLMGAKAGRKYFAEKYIRAKEGDLVADFGCGNAKILAHLDKVTYYGFDISQRYIAAAKQKYGDVGHFFCNIPNQETIKNYPKFDIVLLIGVLHHLSDSESLAILNTAKNMLKKDGRLVTLDPCFELHQNIFARFLISQDRGKFVRNFSQYRDLLNQVFLITNGSIEHTKFIPYTRCMFNCLN